MSKPNVTIKGVKDGLVFILNDSCRYTDMVQELQQKMNQSHDKFFSGPAINVQVKLGSRIINDADREEISEIIGKRDNLHIQSIETNPPEGEEVPIEGVEEVKIIRAMIRSGQTVTHPGSVLLLGDVNPGGTIQAHGDIYVMGSLRGLAHAGFEGNEQAIITASYMQPTQLRIAGIISRPPDEWGIEEAHMEFAYVRDGAMEIDKMNQLFRIRPKGQNML
ncbi:septum site-determining protein MinC [Gorillibacterium massiliense]|uniref:septum site-determining protein MinC n=1 Tax=Gorillibacterium massiliense TaxID=1280390 RepID=UPI0004B11BBE|nr:septum site-determining protein MinC [Gorillibacterium massiliense]